jgi:hypothetical protein
LGWFERDRGFPSALGAGGHGLAFCKTPAAARALTFGLTCLAPFGLVLKILIVEKVLLACGEDEIGTAVYALKDSILKLRHAISPST